MCIRDRYDPGSDQNLYPEITSKSVAWSPDGNFLAGIGAGGKVQVWDVATGDNIAGNISAHGKALALAWSPNSDGDQARLAFVGIDDHVFIFDLATRKLNRSIKQPGWKTGVDWSPDGNKLAISNRRFVNIWDAKTQKRIGQCQGPSAMVRDLSWSSSQDRIAALTEDGNVCVWNASSLAFCAKFNLHKRVPYSILWSPDGKRLVSVARHGRIVFQDID